LGSENAKFGADGFQVEATTPKMLEAMAPLPIFLDPAVALVPKWAELWLRGGKNAGFQGSIP